MSKKQWDQFKDNYEAEIFSVLANDKKQLINKAIKKHGGKSKIASDLGCGIGNFLPLLSPAFKTVYACDISPKLLDRAKEQHQNFDNIEYCVQDLSQAFNPLKKVDFSLSVNSLLSSNLKLRESMLDAIAKQIKKNGILLLVVPSLESALFTKHRLLDWNLKDGIKPAKASKTAFNNIDVKEANDLIKEGTVKIQDTPTKHFLKEELIVSLSKRKLDIMDIQKLEYSWNTEFNRPPKWMQAPYPWDWICVAKKR